MVYTSKTLIPGQTPIGQNRDGSYIYEENMSVLPKKVTPKPIYTPPSLLPMVKSPTGARLMPQVNKEIAQRVNAPVKDTNAILKVDKADPHVQKLQQHFDFLKQKGRLELNQKQSEYIKRYKTKYPDYSNVPDVNLYAKIIQKHPEAMDKYGNIGDKGFFQNLIETPYNFAKSGAETVQRYADRYSEDVAKGGGGPIDTLAAIGGGVGGLTMDLLGSTLNLASPLMNKKNSRYATTFTEGLSQDFSKGIPATIDALSKEGEGYTAGQIQELKDIAKRHPVVADYIEKGLDIANLLPFLGALGKAKSASNVDDIMRQVKTSTSQTVVPGEVIPGLKTAGRNIKETFTPDIVSKDVTTLRAERLRQGLETQNNNLKTVGNSFAKNTKTYKDGGVTETVTPIDTFEKYGITPEIDEKTIKMGDFVNKREGGLGKIQDNVELIGDEIDSTLTATGKKLKTDEYRARVIEAATKDPELRQAGKVQATINKINTRFDDYKQSYGDDIDIFEVNNIRKTANKDWNPETTDVSSIVGDVGRDIVYNATDDMKIKNLLREQGNLLAARKYAQTLNGTKVKGGRLGDYFAGGAGAVAGAIAGSALPIPFLGPAIGAGLGQQVGSKLSKLFSASQFKSPMAELKGIFKSEGAGLPKGKVAPQIRASIESRLLKAKSTPKVSSSLPSGTREVSSTKKLLQEPQKPQKMPGKSSVLSQLPKGKSISAGKKVIAPIIQKTEVKAKLPMKETPKTPTNKKEIYKKESLENFDKESIEDIDIKNAEDYIREETGINDLEFRGYNGDYIMFTPKGEKLAFNLDSNRFDYKIKQGTGEVISPKTPQVEGKTLASQITKYKTADDFVAEFERIAKESGDRAFNDPFLKMKKITPEEESFRQAVFKETSKPKNIAKYEAGATDKEVLTDIYKQFTEKKPPLPLSSKSEVKGILLTKKDVNEGKYDFNEVVNRYAEDIANEKPNAKAKVVDSDILKKMFAEYDPKDPGLVHEESKILADRLFQKYLKEDKSGNVVFSAGGPASGKTEGVISRYLDKDNVVYDHLLSSFETFKKKYNQAIDAGKKIKVHAIYTDIETAKAYNKARGRLVPDIEQKHASFRQAMYDLINSKLYKDGKIKLDLVANNKGKYTDLPSSEIKSFIEEHKNTLDI